MGESLGQLSVVSCGVLDHLPWVVVDGQFQNCLVVLRVADWSLMVSVTFEELDIKMDLGTKEPVIGSTVKGRQNSSIQETPSMVGQDVV